MAVTLIFDGGVRGVHGSAFGSFVLIKDNRRTLTHLEFGGGITAHEAQYDTLITALEVLARQEVPSEIVLEIECPSQLVINQVRGIWRANTRGLGDRRDRVLDQLRQFKSFSLTRISRGEAVRMLSR